MTNWVMHGGSFLGTQKQLPESKMPQIANSLEKFNIHALLIIGGFEVLNHDFKRYFLIFFEAITYQIL